MDNFFWNIIFFLCSNFAIVVQVQVPLVAVLFLPADKTDHDKGRNCPLLIISIRDGDNEEEEGDGGGNHHRPRHREDDHGQDDDPVLVSSDEPGTAGKNSITKVGQVVWCGCPYIYEHI